MTATGARSPAGNSPPEDLSERFARALARLWSEGGSPGGRLGLAVSGGPDSLAMLLLAEAVIPRRFEVATVDHGLRPESAAECAMVRDLCAARRIPCAVLRVLVHGGNLQAEARSARYAALGQWAIDRGLSAVATAHHADDQAETFLMRLNRGSGVAGLAGIRERGAVPGTEVPLLRPLLGFRRAELASVVDAAGLVPVRDPSNANERFDRVRMRRALAGSDWLGVPALATSAANLADADEALEWAARREWDERVVMTEGELRYRPHAPRTLALRVVERAVAALGGEPRGADVARLVDRLQAGGAGNLAGVLGRIENGEWVFRAEPPRRKR